jgi:hypothetical protein
MPPVGTFETPTGGIRTTTGGSVDVFVPVDMVVVLDVVVVELFVVVAVGGVDIVRSDVGFGVAVAVVSVVCGGRLVGTFKVGLRVWIICGPLNGCVSSAAARATTTDAMPRVTKMDMSIARVCFIAFPSRGVGPLKIYPARPRVCRPQREVQVALSGVSRY